MDEKRHPSSQDEIPTRNYLAAAASTGTRIGPYRLLQKVGEGGMGEVWEAGQEKPVSRRVALKLIKAGLDTKQVVARFEAERQALAMMSHPNIARVFDAGATEQGRPFFVMEYLPGVPITDYCDSQRLDTRERLELFMQVCEGAQHAHHKGIIHRDLKPSNILVTVQDGKAVPKIIDFGIAKATDRHLTERTLYTELGQWIGTPEYMSPEQAELTGLDVDTRTDVYSLGAVLYELMVGARIMDSEELRTLGFDEVRRRIREEDPPKPSTRISNLGNASTPVARKRRTEPAALSRSLRGDLDWIVMKALDKERARRYASPHDLAQDIQRHLRHEPVLASPPSVRYRARKFVRRHRIGVAFAAVLTAVLLASVIGMALQARRIAMERDRANNQAHRAEQEAETAQQVSRFLVDLFRISDPSEARGSTVTAREILDRGALEIQQELAGQPLVQARLMGTIGSVYRGLGLYAEAEPLLERSAELQAERLGPGHRGTLDARGSLTDLYILQGRLEAAEAVALEVLQACRTMLGADDELTVAAVNNLAGIYGEQGRYDEAEPLFVESLAISRRLRGADHPDTLRLMNNLAGVYEDLGRHEDSTPLYRETLAGRRRALGDDHPETLSSMNNLAWTLLAQKRHAEAEALLREAVAGFERVLGEEHPRTQVVRSNLGELLLQTGRYAEAEPLLASVLSSVRESLPPGHSFQAVAQRRWAQALGGLGRYEEAEVQLLQVLERLRASFDPGHERVVRAEQALAELYATWGRKDRAALYTSPE